MCGTCSLFKKQVVRAHGRYIARESAVAEANAKTAGPTNIKRTRHRGRLNVWQKAGMSVFWKFIISPQFGDRLDKKADPANLWIGFNANWEPQLNG